MATRQPRQPREPREPREPRQPRQPRKGKSSNGVTNENANANANAEDADTVGETDPGPDPGPDPELAAGESDPADADGEPPAPWDPQSVHVSKGPSFSINDDAGDPRGKNGNGNGSASGVPSDQIDEAFKQGVNSGNFNVAKAAAVGFSEDELRELLTRSYPMGTQRTIMIRAFSKLDREEMITLWGTHCAIWGAGLALGGRLGPAERKPAAAHLNQN